MYCLLSFLTISSVYFTLILDLEHNYPSPFGIQRAFGNLMQLFCFQRKIYHAVYLLEVYQDDNSFGC